jgi:hypothetical protein
MRNRVPFVAKVTPPSFLCGKSHTAEFPLWQKLLHRVFFVAKVTTPSFFCGKVLDYNGKSHDAKFILWQSSRFQLSTGLLRCISQFVQRRCCLRLQIFNTKEEVGRAWSADRGHFAAQRVFSVQGNYISLCL